MNAFLYKDFYMLTKTLRLWHLLFFRELLVTPKAHEAQNYTDVHNSGLTAHMVIWNLTFQMAHSLFLYLYLLNQLLERSIFPHWRTIISCRKLSGLKIITIKWQMGILVGTKLWIQIKVEDNYVQTRSPCAMLGHINIL